METKFELIHCGSLKDRISMFKNQSEKTENKLSNNPFSGTYVKPDLKKGTARYGRPPKGSLTEARGIKAGHTVYREVLELCEMIDQCGAERPDGLKVIRFGTMFRLYTRISDTVVGMLLRARKYGLVSFEGEMLYQRQDDNKIITMNLSYDDIRARLRPSGDPKDCIKLMDRDAEGNVEEIDEPDEYIEVHGVYKFVKRNKRAGKKSLESTSGFVDDVEREQGEDETNEKENEESKGEKSTEDDKESDSVSSLACKDDTEAGVNQNLQDRSEVTSKDSGKSTVNANATTKKTKIVKKKAAGSKTPEKQTTPELIAEKEAKGPSAKNPEENESTESVDACTKQTDGALPTTSKTLSNNPDEPKESKVASKSKTLDSEVNDKQSTKAMTHGTLKEKDGKSISDGESLEPIHVSVADEVEVETDTTSAQTPASVMSGDSGFLDANDDDDDHDDDNDHSGRSID